MPRKGRKIQKDLLGNEAASSVDHALDLRAQERRLAAFEMQNGVLALAIIQSPSKVHSYDFEDILRESVTPLDEGLTSANLKKLLPEPETYFILATEESYPQIMAVKKAGLDIMIIERSLAIYYAHKQEAARKPCLVACADAEQTSCSLIVNESVAARQEDARHLSHRGIWRSYVESQGPEAPLARTIRFYSQKEESFFGAFVSVWKTGKEPQLGKYSFGDQIDLTSSLDSFSKLFKATDPSGQARLVILSGWAAAHCNLAALLRPGFEVIGGDNPNRAFTQALDGLVRFGLAELAIRERPQLKLSTEEIALPRVTKGKPTQAAFRIENAGGGMLQAKLTARDAWLKVTPEAVSCGKNRDQVIAIEAQSAELAAGVTHPTQIEIEWSDGVSVRKNGIQVRVEVMAPVVSTAVKKLVPRSKFPVVPVPPLPDEVVATLPAAGRPPKPVPASPVAQPVTGPILEAPEGNVFRKIGPVMLVVVVVGAFIFFVTLWVPRRALDPIFNSNQSPKNSSQTSGNGDLSVANPQLAPAEPSTAAPNSTPSPFDVSAGNNPTPADDPNSQTGGVTLYANTDDVHVLVDETEATLGRSYAFKTFRLAPGRHSVKATKEGYTSWETSIEVSQGSSSTLNIVLQQTQTPVAEPTPLPSQIALAYERRATELFKHQRYDEAIGECNAGLAVDSANESLLRLKGRIEKAKEILAKPRESDRSPGVENSSPTPVRTAKPPPDRVEPAVMISKASIAYPLAAKNARVSGTVVVAVTIDEQGRVTSARAVDGPVMLRSAAVDAAQRCTFRPARRGAQPVTFATLLNFNFVLN